jgi:hypothetical protein
VLQGLPVSAVLNCGIELWRNLEIDDDELLGAFHNHILKDVNVVFQAHPLLSCCHLSEIAIRDVSYQIQLQKETEEASDNVGAATSAEAQSSSTIRRLPQVPSGGSSSSHMAGSFDSSVRHRFNPRIDPTVLFLEMKNLKLHLDNFFFRIEKKENRTVFDPVFEGHGMVSLQNVSIRLRIDCAKQRTRKRSGGAETSAPILLLRELDVVLENVRLKVKDTGFGSDWLLNRAVHVFADSSKLHLRISTNH